MSKQPGRPGEESRPERLEPFFKDCQAVIVLMYAGETEEQAWRRYIKKHPKDMYAEVLVFTYAEIIFKSSFCSGHWS
jgi:hypothetical protein